MSFDLNNLSEEMFNYDDLNDEHKKAAVEVLRLMQQHGDPLIVNEIVSEQVVYL